MHKSKAAAQSPRHSQKHLPTASSNWSHSQFNHLSPPKDHLPTRVLRPARVLLQSILIGKSKKPHLNLNRLPLRRHFRTEQGTGRCQDQINQPET